MIQRGAPHPADGITGQPVRYQLADHLASVIATLDPAGAVLNTEEYLPYGETSFGSYQRKRYRHTGKERDNESGLAYHSARYYAPWLARWVSADPSGHADGWSLYRYCRASPVMGSDPGGRATQTSPDLSGADDRGTAGKAGGRAAPTPSATPVPGDRRFSGLIPEQQVKSNQIMSGKDARARFLLLHHGLFIADGQPALRQFEPSHEYSSLGVNGSSSNKPSRALP